MGLTRFEILEVWERAHGRLSDDLRQAFLSDQRVVNLTGVDSSVVRSAVAMHPKLDDVLASIATRRADPADPESRRPNTSSRSRYSHGHFPHQPSDSDLHSRIGPTQRYDDDT